MNAQKATGLGEPEPIGKKSLFQPPPKKQAVEKEKPKRVGEQERTPRLRITTDLTQQAMETLQALQHQHRMKTGKSLPAWKIVSTALELYGRRRKDQGAKKG